MKGEMMLQDKYWIRIAAAVGIGAVTALKYLSLIPDDWAITLIGLLTTSAIGYKPSQGNNPPTK